MDKYNFNKCNICKIRGYITCTLCENKVFFCSRGHLHTHQLKFHKENRQNVNNLEAVDYVSYSTYEPKSNKKIEDLNKNNLNSNDPRKVFEQLHKAKIDIEGEIGENKFSEAIINIKKLLNATAKFYQEDNLFVKSLFINFTFFILFYFFTIKSEIIFLFIINLRKNY